MRMDPYRGNCLNSGLRLRAIDSQSAPPRASANHEMGSNPNAPTPTTMLSQ